MFALSGIMGGLSWASDRRNRVLINRQKPTVFMRELIIVVHI